MTVYFLSFIPLRSHNKSPSYTGKLLRNRQWKPVQEINWLTWTWQWLSINYIGPAWALNLTVSVCCHSHKWTEMILHWYLLKDAFIKATSQPSALGLTEWEGGRDDSSISHESAGSNLSPSCCGKEGGWVAHGVIYGIFSIKLENEWLDTGCFTGITSLCLPKIILAFLRFGFS